MPIDFDWETNEITGKLKQAEGYLDCEMIMIYNIRKQVDNGLNDEKIILYLKELSAWFDKKIKANQNKADCTNYGYAAGFVNALLKMPYWKRWMKTIVL